MPHGREDHGVWGGREVTFEVCIHTWLPVSNSPSCGGPPVMMQPIPVVPETHSHVLAEFDCLDPLLSTLRLDSGRLKVGFTRHSTIAQCMNIWEQMMVGRRLKWSRSIDSFKIWICCVTVYLFGSVQEVACIRNISRRASPDSEGGLETKAYPHSQGNTGLNSFCAEIQLVLLLWFTVCMHHVTEVGFS